MPSFFVFIAIPGGGKCLILPEAGTTTKGFVEPLTSVQLTDGRVTLMVLG
jgi:hypothetical protein